jgi:hypothetical protein
MLGPPGADVALNFGPRGAVGGVVAPERAKLKTALSNTIGLTTTCLA